MQGSKYIDQLDNSSQCELGFNTSKYRMLVADCSVEHMNPCVNHDVVSNYRKAGTKVFARFQLSHIFHIYYYIFSKYYTVQSQICNLTKVESYFQII